MGIRNIVIGYRITDKAKILENLVYNHLLYKGYDIKVGYYGDKEIDFIGEKKPYDLRKINAAHHWDSIGNQIAFGVLHLHLSLAYYHPTVTFRGKRLEAGPARISNSPFSTTKRC